MKIDRKVIKLEIVILITQQKKLSQEIHCRQQHSENLSPICTFSLISEKNSRKVNWIPGVTDTPYYDNYCITPKQSISNRQVIINTYKSTTNLHNIRHEHNIPHKNTVHNNGCSKAVQFSPDERWLMNICGLFLQEWWNSAAPSLTTSDSEHHRHDCCSCCYYHRRCCQFLLHQWSLELSTQSETRHPLVSLSPRSSTCEQLTTDIAT